MTKPCWLRRGDRLDRRAVGRRAWRRRRARVGSSRGQTTTEWLMIAGTLTAIAIILGTSMAATLRVFVRSIATSVRTIAP